MPLIALLRLEADKLSSARILGVSRPLKIELRLSETVSRLKPEVVLLSTSLFVNLVKFGGDLKPLVGMFDTLIRSPVGDLKKVDCLLAKSTPTVDA